MPVSPSPRAKPVSGPGGRVGLVRDLAIVAVCVALVAAFLTQLFAPRAAEAQRAPPAAARTP